MFKQIITQGTCCRYDWALLEHTHVMDVFSRFWPFFKRMYCVQCSVAPQVKALPGEFELSGNEEDGKMYYLHPGFGMRTRDEFRRSGTWIFSQYPDSVFKSEVPRFDRDDLPFLHASEAEYYSALPDFWHFVHKNRFDLLLVTLPDDQLFMTWPVAGAGFWINAEIEIGDEPPF